MFFFVHLTPPCIYIVLQWSTQVNTKTFHLSVFVNLSQKVCGSLIENAEYFRYLICRDIFFCAAHKKEAYIPAGICLRLILYVLSQLYGSTFV